MRHFGRQKDIRKREQKVPLTQMPLIKQKQNSKYFITDLGER